MCSMKPGKALSIITVLATHCTLRLYSAKHSLTGGGGRSLSDKSSGSFNCNILFSSRAPETMGESEIYISLYTYWFVAFHVANVHFLKVMEMITWRRLLVRKKKRFSNQGGVEWREVNKHPRIRSERKQRKESPRGKDRKTYSILSSCLHFRSVFHILRSFKCRSGHYEPHAVYFSSLKRWLSLVC